MAEATQVISAAAGLAKVIVQTALLIQRLVEAKAEARCLYHKTKHLQPLATRVRSFLEEWHHEGHLERSPYLSVIRETLTECSTCINALHERLAPLGTSTSKWGDGFSRIKHLYSTDFIRCQEGLIEMYFDTIKLDFSLLQSQQQSATYHEARRAGHFSSQTLAAVKSLARAVLKDASSQQSEVLQLICLDEELIRESSASMADSSQTTQAQVSDGISELGDAQKARSVSTDECSECSKHLEALEDRELTIAVKRHKADQARQLVKADSCSLAQKDADNWTVLHYAARNLDLEMLNIILSEPTGKSLIDDMTKQGQTALMMVAEQAEAMSSIAFAKVLLDHGCNRNVQDDSEEKRSALYWAIDGPKTKKRLEFVELLKRGGADETQVIEALPSRAKDFPILYENATTEYGDDVDSAEHAESKRRKSLRESISKVFSRNSNA